MTTSSGAAKAHDRINPSPRRAALPATPVVARVRAPRALLLAHGRELVRRAAKMIGGPPLQQVLRHFAVPLNTRGLQQRLAIQVQVESPQRLNERPGMRA